MAIAFAHDGAFTHRNGFHNVGVTIGVFSDLRNSGHLHDAALWKAAVAMTRTRS